MMEPIYVVFAIKEDEAKLTQAALTKIITFMDQYSKENNNPNTVELLNAVLIVNSGTQFVKKNLNQYDPFVLEEFKQEELLVNITRHELVPKHMVLSDTEKAELLKRYRCKESQLPKI